MRERGREGLRKGGTEQGREREGEGMRKEETEQAREGDSLKLNYNYHSNIKFCLQTFQE